MTTAQTPTSGWHWKEWAAEFVGTAILFFALVTAKFLAVWAGPPFSELMGRIIIIGTAAGLAVFLIAIGPLGRRSGAHLNPAVTFGLFIQRTVSLGDLVAYCLAQCAGGVIGVLAGRLWGPLVAQATVNWAVIAPAPWMAQAAAAGIEAVVVLIQLAIVFSMLRSDRWNRWTAVFVGASLTALIITLAPVTGAGLNPIRGLAPDIAANNYPAIWIYLAGPVAGAAVAAAVVVASACGKSPLTGKLFHDPTIPCYMRCELDHAKSPSEEQESNLRARAADGHRRRGESVDRPAARLTHAPRPEQPGKDRPEPRSTHPQTVPAATP